MKEWNSDPEHRVVEIIQAEQKKEKKKNNEKSLIKMLTIKDKR